MRRRSVAASVVGGVVALSIGFLAGFRAAPPPDGAHRIGPVPVQSTSEEPAPSGARSGADATASALAPSASGIAPEPPPPLATPATQVAESRPSATSRRRYRSRRNRYPGRIPTPAEWEPPEGPVRIALQAGHWRADEAPRELSGLRDNGANAAGIPEWEANLEIARAAARMLRYEGYEVDILPAVVPPSYRAHLFISIHADGSADGRATGYRVAAPRRDATGRADGFASILERTYGRATGLARVPTTTRRMRNYYAFNYRRYEHALHPMTIGVIIETGFLTSASDRRVIIDDPDRPARGIVDAVMSFSETPPPGRSGQ